MKSNPRKFFPIISFLWVKLSWKTCLLVTSAILGLFVNTLSADGKYFFYKGKTFGQANQMQLSKKRKICDQFFVEFLEFTPKFQHFEKEDQANPILLTPKDLVT